MSRRKQYNPDFKAREALEALKGEHTVADYHEIKGETAFNLALMRLIDKQFLETPFYGVRQMVSAR